MVPFEVQTAARFDIHKMTNMIIIRINSEASDLLKINIFLSSVIHTLFLYIFNSPMATPLIPPLQTSCSIFNAAAITVKTDELFIASRANCRDNPPSPLLI